LKNYISNKEISKIINRFEKNNDILKYQYENWSLWPIIRWHVIRDLQNRKDDLAKQKEKKKKMIFPIIKNLLKISRASPKDYFVYTFSRFRSENKKGLSKDIYFDDVINSARNNFIKCEEQIGKGLTPYGENTFINCDFSLLPIHFFAEKLSKIRNISMLNEKTIEMWKIIEYEFKNLTFDFQKIKHKVYVFYFTKLLFKYLFKFLKTKKIFFIGQPLAMIAAAKELKIVCIEFQHGYLDRFHHGYSYGSYSKKYKPQLPLPEKIMLYGDFFKDELKHTNFWIDEQLYTIGKKTLQKYRESHLIKKSNNKNKRILITTQGFDTKNLIKFYDNFFSVINKEYNVTIKLHPQYDKYHQDWKKLVKNYENVNLSNEIDSIKLINECDIHMTIWSTTHIEAIGLGKTSIVMPLKGYKNMQNLIDRKFLFFASDHNELEKIVNDIMIKTTNKTDISYYFYKNYSEKRVLEYLL
jgi:hypothetical protein